jgi:hypothetical protein
MKFKTQKSVTDKITSNNLNSMGFNSFVYCVQHLIYCLFMDTLKLTTHPVIYGVKAAHRKNIGLVICAWDEMTSKHLARFCTSIKYLIISLAGINVMQMSNF